jgi:hypothetical protein
MKRFFILGCLCLAVHLQAQGATSTNADVVPRPGEGATSTNAETLPRPEQRFLFLIDTSSAMSHQKTVTMDTMSRMILSGIGGRLQKGDLWCLWTLDDKLHTDVIPVQKWDPERRGDLANQIYRYLRDHSFKKKALLGKSLAVVAEEANFSGTLTVFLFTDGSKPVKGTPFDQSINEIFAKHGDGMRKAKKPFVIVFVTRDGRFAAHAVSPGGERIYIPRLPEALAAAKKTEAPAKTNAVTVPAAPGRILTAAEFSDLLLQSQKKHSNTVALAPAPLIVRGTASQTNQVAPESLNKPATESPNKPATEPLSKAATETLVPIPTSSALASDTPVAPDRSLAIPRPSSAITPASPVRTEPSAPTEEQASGTGQTDVPSTPPADELPAATSEKTVEDTAESLAGSPASAQTALLAQQEPPFGASIYLMAAVALMLIALILVWLYIRSIRYVPRPSLISRSLEKEKQ